jgi:hypothetical protein
MPLHQSAPSRSIDEHEPPTRLSKPPVRERIKLRAFEIYKERGGFPGSAMIDWLRAQWECEADEAGSVYTRN